MNDKGGALQDALAQGIEEKRKAEAQTARWEQVHREAAGRELFKQEQLEAAQKRYEREIKWELLVLWEDHQEQIVRARGCKPTSARGEAVSPLFGVLEKVFVRCEEEKAKVDKAQ